MATMRTPYEKLMRQAADILAQLNDPKAVAWILRYKRLAISRTKCQYWYPIGPRKCNVTREAHSKRNIITHEFQEEEED